MFSFGQVDTASKAVSTSLLLAPTLLLQTFRSMLNSVKSQKLDQPTAPQGVLEGARKSEIARRFPEAAGEAADRRWPQGLHRVDQVSVRLASSQWIIYISLQFQKRFFAIDKFYHFFGFSHAEDLDPEEGEEDVDSQLSGQQGGEKYLKLNCVTYKCSTPTSQELE